MKENAILANEQRNYKHETNGNSRTKSVITEMKKSLNGLNIRLETAEKGISKLDRSIDITQSEEEGKKIEDKQNPV